MTTQPVLKRSTPTAAELDFLEDRLYEHNIQQTGPDDGQLFAFLLRDDLEGGEIIGGISGWTWAGACEIRTLWVHPDWRGQGCGRDLLAAAEGEARARACKVIMLTSYSFQAPGFYQQQGYELAWELHDFPPGHRQCGLVKRLDANPTPPDACAGNR